jgi:hypothetical protein
MLDDRIWSSLEETKGIAKGARSWGVRFRGSLRQISSKDGAFLLERLQEQAQSQTEYPLSERDERQLARRKVRTLTGEVEVEVPEKEPIQAEASDNLQVAKPPAAVDSQADREVRRSIQIQAQIAEIGAKIPLL